MHRAQLVVELRQHDAARSLVGTEPRPKQRNRPARVRQLKAHQHHQTEPEQQKEQAGDRVLDTDHFVIDRKDVLAPET